MRARARKYMVAAGYAAAQVFPLVRPRAQASIKKPSCNQLARAHGAVWMRARTAQFESLLKMNYLICKLLLLRRVFYWLYRFYSVVYIE